MKARGRRPSAFIVFEWNTSETRWNTKHEFLKLLLQQKKISLNYHLNKFSQFNYYISQGEISCFRISETWRKHATPCFRYVYVLRKCEKCKSTWFRHVSGTEMPSHVSVIFKPPDFRCCSFPSCFCKRICSCLLHLPKHKREMVLWTTTF